VQIFIDNLPPHPLVGSIRMSAPWIESKDLWERMAIRLCRMS
jgi:hypothetical protein